MTSLQKHHRASVSPCKSFIYLFGVLRRFQHCTGHITTGSWKGRGNQYIEFARVVYCKLPTNSKQLPAFPLKVVTGIEPRPQRWEARVLPPCHRAPPVFLFIWGLRRFQHCTGHITTGSWKGRGNQYIQFIRVLYCKLPTNGKQLPAFPLETVRGSNPGLRGGRRECYHSATVAPPPL